MRRSAIRLAVVLPAFLAAVPLMAEPITLVACAPGYPGNTVQAQPSMDAFARGVADAAGWEPGRLAAVYHEKLDAGLDRLERDDAALALVPLPFYLEFRDRLKLTPLLRVAQASGEVEVWTLVARRGAVSGTGSLAGWGLAGMPGYSPRFVRRVALADWGPIPDDTSVRFTSRVLSRLRRAAAGEPIAVLLDTAQADALDQLPFAADLEVVTRSGPTVPSLLCRVGDRIEADAERQVLDALFGLAETEAGAALLESIRVQRFQELSPSDLEGVQRDFGTSN